MVMRIGALILFLVGAAWGQELTYRGALPPSLPLGDVIELELVLPEGAVMGPIPSSTDFAILHLRPRSDRSAVMVSLRPLRKGEVPLPIFRVERGDERFASPATKVRVSHDRQGEQWARLSVLGPDRNVWRGEVITMELRLAFDADFGADHLLPRRGLDWAFGIEVDWWEGKPGWKALPVLDAMTGPKIALNGKGVQFESVPTKDPNERVLVHRRRFMIESEGPLDLNLARLRFRHAQRFREDLIRGRVAEDPRRELVVAFAAPFVGRALPLDGKPTDFQGAVGRFELTSVDLPSALAVGQTVTHQMRVSGEGLSASLVPPRFESPSFHVLGRRHRVDEGGVLITTDLVLINPDCRRWPTQTWAYFDPTPPGRYREAKTSSPAFSVRPLKSGESVELASGLILTGREPGRTDIHGQRSVLDGPRAFDFDALANHLAWLLPLGALVFGAIRLFWSRISAEERAARRAWRRVLASSPHDDRFECITVYLSSRLQTSPSAVVDGRLAARLVNEGVATKDADAVAQLIVNLTARRFDPESEGPVQNEDLAVLENIEGLFRSRGKAS